VTEHPEHPEHTEHPEHAEHAEQQLEHLEGVEVEDVRDPRIAAAVARLDGLTETAPAEHVEVYEDVHRVLQDALADAAVTSETGDQGEPGPGGARS
jgi:hypothetical protein